MKRNMQGFTLIELMIVVAIIAILAAIAISQYQDYVIRTQVSEGSSLVAGMKTAVTEFHNNTGRFAQGTNVSYGLATNTSITGKYVANAAVAANTGLVTITYGNEAHATELSGDTLIFSPIVHAGSMAWSCEGGTVASKYRPSVCRQ